MPVYWTFAWVRINRLIHGTLDGSVGHHPGGSTTDTPQSSHTRRGDGVPSSAEVLRWIQGMEKG